MNCENCGKTWGVEAWPEIEEMMYLTRTTRILGVQGQVKDDFIWDLDYDNAAETEGDLLEWGYVCSYCGSNIHKDDIEKVVTSYSEED